MGILSKELGTAGEEQALEYLQLQGFSILRQNFTSKYGEIDIVAQENGTLVFVEVKSYKENSLMDPLEAITPSKIKKLLKTARYYMMRFYSEEPPSRFDVIVLSDGRVREHLKGAIK